MKQKKLIIVSIAVIVLAVIAFVIYSNNQKEYELVQTRMEAESEKMIERMDSIEVAANTEIELMKLQGQK